MSSADAREWANESRTEQTTFRVETAAKAKGVMRFMRKIPWPIFSMLLETGFSSLYYTLYCLSARWSEFNPCKRASNDFSCANKTKRDLPHLEAARRQFNADFYCWHTRAFQTNQFFVSSRLLRWNVDELILLDSFLKRETLDLSIIHSHSCRAVFRTRRRFSI